jgi:hypothetical protein
MVAQPSAEPSATISKELRLRWLIASSRVADGRVQENCQPTPPKLEQVQAWLAAGAKPSFVPGFATSGLSTVALARLCGFTEAADAMQAAMQ